MPRVHDFDGALADAQARWRGNLSLLLGNGFSVDYNPRIFRYTSLAKEAELRGLSVPKRDLFRTLGSSNFETVIDKLQAASKLQSLYDGDVSLARKLSRDARAVRNGLADVIAARHPDSAVHLEVEEIRHARQFLSNFARIFTLSYDLLLYWVVNASSFPAVDVPIRDGFEWPTRSPSTDLIWKMKPTYRQEVFYLHGALHYFVEADGRLHKLMYLTRPILEELRARLRTGRYPLIVTEGTSSEKEARIDKSPYLRTGLRRFGELSGAVFIHGVSMHPNDDHILRLLEQDTNEVEGLYVGVHRPGTPRARGLMARAEEVAENRTKNGGSRLRLKFYDAQSARVWRS